MFSIAYAEGAAWNDSFWSHDRFNKLLKQARAELDREKRQEMYSEMQGLVRDQGGVVIPLFVNNVFARRDHIKHREDMAGAWDLDGLKAMERWWMET
jgi:peptide/nickel transport system substrate-binding protein